MWECDLGHRFIATPAEQRSRPGRERRRSAWCPECHEMARPKPWIERPGAWPDGIPTPARRARSSGPRTLPNGIRSASSPQRTSEGSRRPRPLCSRTPPLAPGTAFVSTCAPAPASAAEGALREGLRARFILPLTDNAIRLRNPFFDHLEVWPDILIPELRIAVEYDTLGRHGLEHVGRREAVDRRKDRAIRASGWEVVRVRIGRLSPIGPYDLALGSDSNRLPALLIDRFRDIRGPLLVDAYLR